MQPFIVDSVPVDKVTYPTTHHHEHLGVFLCHMVGWGGVGDWGRHITPSLTSARVKAVSQVLYLTAFAFEGTSQSGHPSGPVALQGPCAAAL